MTAPESTASPGPPASSNEPVSTLRGAGVNYDARRVGQVAVGLCLLTLLALVIIFTIAGVDKNSQINQLRHHGVPVDVTITGCLGLMGGSGSNAAGYSCTGSFTIHGSRYSESLPGTGFHRPGQSVRAVVVPDDPALVSPVSVLKTQHTSLSVFILPAALLIVLAALVALIMWRRRRQGAPPPEAPKAP